MDLNPPIHGAQPAQIEFASIALVSTFGTFIAVFLLLRGQPPHSFVFNFGMALICALMVGMYMGLGVLTDSRRKRESTRTYESGEHVELERHVARSVKRLHFYPWMFLAAIFLIGSLGLRIVVPVVHLGHTTQAGVHKTADIPYLWVLPLICGLPLLFVALTFRERDKRIHYIITDRRLMIRRDLSPLVFFLASGVDETVFDQIFDVDVEARDLAGPLSYGTVKVTKFPSEHAGQTETIYLDWVTEPSEFAFELRKRCPRVRPSTPAQNLRLQAWETQTEFNTDF